MTALTENASVLGRYFGLEPVFGREKIVIIIENNIPKLGGPGI